MGKGSKKLKNTNEQQKMLLQTLQKEVKNLKSEWSPELGVFKQLEGDLGRGRPGEKPEGTAQRFAVRFSGLLGPGGTGTQYRVFRNVAAQQGGRRISIQLVMNKLVVLDGMIVVYVDDRNVVKKVRSSLPRDITMTAKPRIKEKDLIALLMKIFLTHPDAEEYLQKVLTSNKPDTVTHVPSGRLAFPLTSAPRMALRRTKEGFHPVWMGFAILPVDVATSTRKTEWVLTQAQYFLDASNGELIKAEATVEYAEVSTPVQGYAVIRPDDTLVVVNAQGVQKDGAEYYLKNIDKDIPIIVYDAGGDGTNIPNRLNGNTLAVSQDADGNWDVWTDACDQATRKDSQQPEIDALRFVTQIYEFYEALGWKGFDNEGWGAGCPVRVVIHIGASIGTGASFEKYTDTASGNMHGYMQFYDGGCEGGALKYDFYAGELGTICHEFQHGVTYFAVPASTGDPGGLYSDTIRGAMREGFSDSFAGFISGIWLIRAPWPTGIGVNGPPMRRIEYPRSVDNLDAAANCDHYDDIGSVNDKYYKSCVLSYLAYLVGQGGVHDRASRAAQYIPVPPLGLNTGATIWHNALKDKFDTLPAGGGDQRMIDVGKYLLETAEDLYGNRSKEYVLLRRGLYAIGLYPYNDAYVKQTYGGEACMMPWGWDWRNSQQYLSLPMFHYWSSMDLFIDNGEGAEYDAVIGAENKVYARVRNIGDQDLTDVDVEFLYRKAGSALPPEETEWKRCKNMAAVDCTLHIATLPAGDMNFEDVYTDSDCVMWYLDPSEISDAVDHFCLRAKIICLTSPNHDNDYENYVQSNVHHVPADPDSDTDSTITFRVGNPDRKREIPLVLYVEHSLPRDVVLKPLFDEKKIILKPREEKIVQYKLLIPKGILKALNPPFDGELAGSIYGDLCGPFSGNLSQVKHEKKGIISATIAGKVGKIGSITGRFTGKINRKNATVEGRALVSFSPAEGRRKEKEFMIGLDAKLSPIRAVNFTQMVDGKAIGGITARVVLKIR
jgi:Zn-dependent metalloprotease